MKTMFDEFEENAQSSEELSKIREARALLAPYAWNWFRLHQDEVIVNLIVWKKRWRDLRHLWERIWGPEVWMLKSGGIL